MLLLQAAVGSLSFDKTCMVCVTQMHPFAPLSQLLNHAGPGSCQHIGDTYCGQAKALS